MGAVGASIGGSVGGGVAVGVSVAGGGVVACASAREVAKSAVATRATAKDEWGEGFSKYFTATERIRWIVAIFAFICNA